MGLPAPRTVRRVALGGYQAVTRRRATRARGRRLFLVRLWLVPLRQWAPRRWALPRQWAHLSRRALPSRQALPSRPARPAPPVPPAPPGRQTPPAQQAPPGQRARPARPGQQVPPSQPARPAQQARPSQHRRWHPGVRLSPECPYRYQRLPPAPISDRRGVRPSRNRRTRQMAARQRRPGRQPSPDCRPEHSRWRPVRPHRRRLRSAGSTRHPRPRLSMTRPLSKHSSAKSHRARLPRNRGTVSRHR